MTGQHEHRQRQREVLRRATVYVYGFLGAALAIAAVGAALLAWFLTRRGMPFLETWIILMIVILVPSLVMIVWRAVRERRSRGKPE